MSLVVIPVLMNGPKQQICKLETELPANAPNRGVCHALTEPPAPSHCLLFSSATGRSLAALK